MKMDLSKIDNIVFGDVREWDRPDFCDAYILSADLDGRTMTEEELAALTENREFVYSKLMENYVQLLEPFVWT